jgi:hypothetical protein
MFAIVGGLLTCVIVSVTIPGNETPVSRSAIVYWNVSVVSAVALPVYVTLPFVPTVTVPLAGC